MTSHILPLIKSILGARLSLPYMNIGNGNAIPRVINVVHCKEGRSPEKEATSVVDTLLYHVLNDQDMSRYVAYHISGEEEDEHSLVMDITLFEYIKS